MAEYSLLQFTVSVPQAHVYLQPLVVHQRQALRATAGYALNLSGVLSKAHAHVANVGHPTYLGIQILQKGHKGRMRHVTAGTRRNLVCNYFCHPDCIFRRQM